MTSIERARKKWHKANPWRRPYYLARNRCKPNHKYGKRGIRFYMTIEDFKYLWFRDKAFDMKEPSIDRVNTKGDYILTNCRFIELQENRWRYGRKPVLQYSLEGKFIKRHETLMRAAKETSINISLISNVAHGRKNKTAGGYKWKLAMKTGKK